ncbi:MAG: glycoside-pentoside-hexuronide (GPH):cation symporter [Lachnospiraceae bacterium]|nr:glycoside-pentoside-hexuronide (GPH):cation symporter [Lachnospiraceae bacterium]
MSRKPLGKDRYGVQKVMHIGDYFSDSLGQFSLNIISGLVGQLTYFYTDKVGLAAGAVATMLLICKIFDAFTDVIMGNIVDHTAPGKEKYRPWILRMAIPAALLIVALFTVPSGWSETGQLAYLFVTNFLLSAVVYTAICIPYASILVVRTNSQEERGTMGIWRAAAGYVSGMIIAIAVIPATNALGGTQSAWIKVGAVFGLFIALALLLCFLRAKESAVDAKVVTSETEQDDEEPVPFKEALKLLFQNKYWVMILLMNFCAQVSYGINGAAGTYYCKWIYGNDNLVSIQGAIGMIPTILGFALVGPMTKKLGVTKTLRVSFMIGVIGTALRLINPAHFVYNTTLSCFATFANIPMMCLLGVMSAMAIDYNEYKYGKRMVATAQSACSFGNKVGSGIGASIIGWCLGLAAYDGMAKSVSPAVIQAIYTFSIYIPLALFIFMFILAMRYDLEAKLPEYQAEIAKRKQA